IFIEIGRIREPLQTFERGPFLVVAGVGIVASKQPERGTETFHDQKPLDRFDEIKVKGIDRNPIAL
ncbi:hypothetical protein CFP56_023625, partial [Quercus suber]